MTCSIILTSIDNIQHHDTKHNDIQHNNIQHNVIQPINIQGLLMTLSMNDTQNKWHWAEQLSTIMLHVVMLTVVFYLLFL